jgi:hypothetical protein
MPYDNQRAVARIPGGALTAQVFSSHGCYDSLNISGATIETDGLVISFTL